MKVERLPYGSSVWRRAMNAAKPRRFPPSARRTRQPPPDFTEHAALIRARRAEINRRVWRSFLKRGLQTAWTFLHGAPATCPDLTLEPSDFLIALGLNPVGMREETALEVRLRERLLAIERAARRRDLAARALMNPTRYRRARLVLAVPPWADRSATRAVYLACRERNIDAGFKKYRVRHIIPLVDDPYVCGLHVASNLTVTAR